MPNLALNLSGEIWHKIPVEDPYAARFYDDHYSRQTPGSKGILAPGQRALWWHEGKSRPPGYCYECAGWTWVRSMLAGHGRPRKAVYEAPR